MNPLCEGCRDYWDCPCGDDMKGCPKNKQPGQTVTISVQEQQFRTAGLIIAIVGLILLIFGLFVF